VCSSEYKGVAPDDIINLCHNSVAAWLRDRERKEVTCIRDRERKEVICLSEYKQVSGPFNLLLCFRCAKWLLGAGTRFASAA